MRRIIFVTAIILVTTFFNNSFSRDVEQRRKKSRSKAISSLVINANVTVMLVDETSNNIQVDGNGHFSDQIKLVKRGRRLIIRSRKNEDLKSSGVVYVPANRLGYILINNGALVRSLSRLRTPDLLVEINSECEVSVATAGKFNLRSTDDYTYIHTTRSIQRTDNSTGKTDN